MYDQELKICKVAAVEAGKAILDIYNSDDFGVEHKVDGDYVSPLTKADLASHNVIAGYLNKHFLYHILSEEDKDDLSRLSQDMLFIVDPLDGTKEFIKRNGEFTVNIALVKDKKPVLGVIYVPITKELFYAVKDEGAFLEKDGRVEQLYVSDVHEFSSMVAVQSRSHATGKLAQFLDDISFKDVIISGSSVKGCLIAKQRVDVYPRLGPITEWDICAMHIIITEAGGKITYFDGTEVSYNNKDLVLHDGFLASNGKAHAELLKVIKQL